MRIDPTDWIAFDEQKKQCAARPSTDSRAFLVGRKHCFAHCFLPIVRRLGSERPDRIRGAAAPDQLHGDHARGRGSRDPGDVGIRLVVQVVQSPRQPQLGLAYEGRIEFVIWSIPALMVILLGGVIWIGSHQLDPRAPIAAKANPLRVDVVSLDWKWLFIYPDQGIAAVNQLIIPAGTPVRFRLTSATVMNSFFVPQLGSQIYTMGGMTTHLNLLAGEPGEYPGLLGKFQRRRLFRHAVHREGGAGRRFRRLGGAGARHRELRSTIPGYAELAKPGTGRAPTTYRSVAPKLFERILDQTAAGPAKARPGAAWYPPCQAGG